MPCFTSTSDRSTSSWSSLGRGRCGRRSPGTKRPATREANTGSEQDDDTQRQPKIGDIVHYHERGSGGGWSRLRLSRRNSSLSRER
jgi:hypothetical protein